MNNLNTLAELAAALPAATKDNAVSLVSKMGEVIEGIGDKPIEWRPSTLKLVQATTDRTKLPKGTSPGSILVGEEIVEQPFEVYPLRTWISRQMWSKDLENARMLCSSPDGETGFQYGNCKACAHSKFDENANKSDCNKTITALAISGDLSKVFFVNFSKTNYANGTDWQALQRKAGVAPYKRRYTLSSGSNPKYKNVEILKAEPIVASATDMDDATLAFLSELFKVSGVDRANHLLKFKEYVESKKSNALLEANAEMGITLLPAMESDAPGSDAPISYNL
jgi:hypothetical protein